LNIFQASLWVQAILNQRHWFKYAMSILSAIFLLMPPFPSSRLPGKVSPGRREDGKVIYSCPIPTGIELTSPLLPVSATNY
jgi:hypothetical protein